MFRDMPITYHIDSARQLVTVRASGRVTYRDVVLYYRDLRASLASHPLLSELADLREVSGAEITASEISSLANMAVFGATAKRALVTQSDLVYGLCRMFIAYSSFNAEHNISVFHEMEEGRRWLELDDSPEAESIRIAS